MVAVHHAVVEDDTEGHTFPRDDGTVHDAGCGADCTKCDAERSASVRDEGRGASGAVGMTVAIELTAVTPRPSARLLKLSDILRLAGLVTASRPLAVLEKVLAAT